ncbi:M14 family zinc carboxypeptidase, partial [Mariniflexile jejuense]
MKKITLLSCLLFLFVQLSFSQNETFSKRISIPNPSQSTLLKIKNAGIDLNCGPKFVGNNLEMELGNSDLVQLQENGIYYNVLIDDLVKYYEERNAIELPKAKAELNKAKFLARQNKSKSDKVSSAKTLSLKNTTINNPAQHDDCDEIEWTEPANFQLGSMGGCLTVSETLAQLDLMRSLYPNLISVKTDASSTGQKTHGNSTGSTTWPGQTVYYVRISDNPDINEPNEPETLITGMMHAREANSLMNVMYFMWYILENYNSDPYIKNIVDNQELYFIPITNPDGVRWNEVIAPSGGGLQRKNLGPSGYNSGTTASSNNKRGVDLNRNFNYYWGWDNSGSSPTTNSDTFRGLSAGSEPETQIVQDFITNHDIKVAVNHHGGLNSIVTSSYNGYINAADSGREDEYAKICHDLTQYNRYIYGSAPNTLYEANGDVNDWMLGGPSVNSNGTISSGSGKNVLALTPENGDDFWPTPSLFVPIAKRAMRMNFIAVMHSGKFAKLHDLNKSNLTSTSGNLTFGVEYLGKTYGNITLTVTPVSSNITSMTSPSVQSGWTKLQQRNLNVPYTLNAGIQPNDEIEFQVTLSNDDFIIYRANFVKYYQPTILFQDNDVNTSNWTTSGGTWGTTTNAYVGSVAITDSPSGAYSNNENKTITLTNPINLSSSTQALVQFYAKWELERNFDLVQLEARRDAGSTWTPLCGKYNKPAATSVTNYHLNKTTGTFQSTNGSIVYDGDSMDKWVMEEILINAADNNFLLGGTAVQFRFVFKTDSTNREDDLTTTFDGFTFDDFKVMSIQVPCVTSVPTGIVASPIAASTATINWNYIASATYDLRYRIVGSPTWTSVSGLSSPTTSLTSLTPSTNYEVQVRSNCGTNNSAYSNSLNFTTTAITYCTSSGSNSTGGYIGNVTFGSINNSSGFGSGYSNFTSISTNATIGSSYNISVAKAWPGTLYNDAIRVWIDYNKDGDFDDAGEQILNSTASKTTPISTSVTIPSTASLGATRMRVSLKYNTSQTSCESFTYGEVEDYAINILPNCTKPTDVVTNATICSGASYTWSVNSVVYTTSQSSLRITNDGCTADQVLNLTVTPKPADVVTNATICSGASYTWSVNSVVYTTSQSGL